MHIITHKFEKALKMSMIQFLILKGARAMDSWIQKELRDIPLGDRRLVKRASIVLNRLSTEPMASIPANCRSWSETKASYRFFDHDKVTSEAILSPHKAATLQRVQAHHRVFLLQDTAELNYRG